MMSTDSTGDGVPNGWAQFETIVQMFDISVQTYANRPCLDFLGKEYSYAELATLTNQVAQGFQQMGLGEGSRIGLCLPNTPYYVACYFAILKIGGIVVNFNPLYVERELEYQINDSGTELMVTLNLEQIYPKVAACLSKTTLKRIVVCDMKSILSPLKSVLFSLLKRKDLASFPNNAQHVTFADVINNIGQPQPVQLKVDSVAVLQYTGGTTGVPKGAMLTHTNLAANTNQLCNWVPDWDRGNERILAVLPFFHVFAMTVIMNVGLATGSKIVMLPRFDLKQSLAVIAKQKVTYLVGVPTIFSAINTFKNLKKYDVSSLKYCLSGGASLPLEVKKEFEHNSGSLLIEGYGLSEASPVVSANPFLAQPRENSIGLPLEGTIIEIRDPENIDTVMPTGEKGEVCAKGPQVMAGYWQNPEVSAEVLVNGFLCTGDIGYKDDDGYIYLVDRIKDVILCSGYNVYPRNIEEALYLHPAVAEVTVIGIDDPYRGQTPKAFVKRTDGHELVSDKDFFTFLADKLSKIEMPSHIEFRDELPKTMIGKLSKKELVEEESQKKSSA